LISFLALQAALELVRFDAYLLRGDFCALYDRVHSYPVADGTAPTDAVERVCSAIDRVCIWYWKEALCLQRSAATACLLRRFGVPAQMVIGVQPMSFQWHAWVEVAGRVVNDRPYMLEMYTVLDRC
jgi:hypothetical protein